MPRAWFISILFAAALLFPALSNAQSAPPAQTQGFGEWLDGVKAEAVGRGIRPETVETVLSSVEPIDKVVELDRKQPEFTLTLDEYLARVVSAKRVADGRARLEQNQALLAQISARYGVPARFIVALWGIESDFGRLTGGYDIVPALATLAYDGRRSQYFRTELMNVLTMVDSGKARPDQLRGSWAGAMGQCQFMPSTYLRYAVDWNGDGHPDIWSSLGDVFASAANYLSSSGWVASEGWGRKVTLPANGIAPVLLGLNSQRAVTEWKRLGVTDAQGNPLPDGELQASLVMVGEANGGTPYLVYDNFRVIMKWNRSTFFAVAAGTLADRLASK